MILDRRPFPSMTPLYYGTTLPFTRHMCCTSISRFLWLSVFKLVTSVYFYEIIQKRQLVNMFLSCLKISCLVCCTMWFHLLRSIGSTVRWGILNCLTSRWFLLLLVVYRYLNVTVCRSSKIGLRRLSGVQSITLLLILTSIVIWRPCTLPLILASCYLILMLPVGFMFLQPLIHYSPFSFGMT